METKSFRILLVEDDDDHARLTESQLSHMDTSTVLIIAGTLGEALEHLKAEAFDLILTDLNLPTSKGLDTLNHILAAAGVIPVVVLTGVREDEIGDQAIKSGAEDYLVKDETYVNLLGRSIRYAIERKKLKSELQSNEQRWRKILSLCPVVVYTCLPHSGYPLTFISGGIETQLGYTAEEFLGQPGFWVDRIHPEDRERILSGLDSLFETGKHLHEYRFLTKDGVYRWMRDELSLIRDETGEPKEIIGQWIDITERRQIEEKLSESEMKCRSIIEHSPTGIALKDTQGRYIIANEALCRILGIEGGQKDIVSKTAYEILSTSEADFTTAQDAFILKEKKGLTDTYQFHKGTPNARDVVIYKFPIMGIDDEVRAIASIDADITELKRVEKELHTAQKMAALGELAAGIAHNFNNLLLPILGLSDRSVKRLPEDSELSTQLSAVVSASIQAKELVAQIMAFCRQSKSEPALVEAYAFMNNSLNLVRLTLPSTIILDEKLDGNTGLVMIDQTTMATVILNVITNAVDAIDGENGNIQVSLSPATTRDKSFFSGAELKPGNYAKITISDTGSGMDAATMDKAFEPFFTTKGQSAGNGLGLSTAYGVVTQHYGAIRATSEVGKGSTFEIFIPLVKSKAIH